MGLSMSRDFLDMLSELSAVGAEYLIVGAHALAIHGRPRSTGDLGIWVRPTAANAALVWKALARFGAPTQGLSEADLVQPDVVLQIGQPPCRIDLLTSIDGLTFDEAWPRRVSAEVEGQPFPALGREDLLTNKRAVGRPQDLADVAWLERGQPEESAPGP
jgi:hypothetical protein